MPVLEGEQYLLEKERAPSPPVYRWGSRDPRGKGVGSRAHRGWGGPCLNRTQPWPRLCVPECQLVFPIVGDPAVHPASCVILENILTWSDPNRMVQEEHEQRSSLAEGAGGGGGSGVGSLALPMSCNSLACSWGPILALSCALWMLTWMASQTCCEWRPRFTTFKERRAESTCTV